MGRRLPLSDLIDRRPEASERLRIDLPGDTQAGSTLEPAHSALRHRAELTGPGQGNRAAGRASDHLRGHEAESAQGTLDLADASRAPRKRVTIAAAQRADAAGRRRHRPLLAPHPAVGGCAGLALAGRARGARAGLAIPGRAVGLHAPQLPHALGGLLGEDIA